MKSQQEKDPFEEKRQGHLSEDGLQEEEEKSFFGGLMGLLGVTLLLLVIFAVLVGVFVVACYGLGVLLARFLPFSVTHATFLALLGVFAGLVFVPLVVIAFILSGCSNTLRLIGLGMEEFSERGVFSLEGLDELEDSDQKEDVLSKFSGNPPN